MGAGTQQEWAARFVEICDGLYGRKLWSLRSFLISTIVSVTTVVAVSYAFHLVSLPTSRGFSVPSINYLIIYALALNVVADYFSLAQTRLFLKFISQKNSIPRAAIFFATDLIASAIIIFLFIAVLSRALPEAGISGNLSDAIGLFSLSSVFFLSTFSTSAWIFLFLVSSLVFRFTNWLKPERIFDVEKSPDTILSLLVGIVAFFITIGLSPLAQRDVGGLSPFDHSICAAFPESACEKVADLTSSEIERLTFLLDACEKHTVAVCTEAGHSAYRIRPEEARELLSTGCGLGSQKSCNGYASMLFEGLGGEKDVFTAGQVFKESCGADWGESCTGLGLLLGEVASHEELMHFLNVLNWKTVNPLVFYKRGCSLESAFGCFRAAMYIAKNPSAGRLSEIETLIDNACEYGHERSCGMLTMFGR